MSKRLGIVGAAGKMGASIIKVLSENNFWKLSAAIIEPGADLVGKKIECCQDVSYNSDLNSLIYKCDLVIDFSAIESSLKVAQLCAEKSIPLLIGVTGFSGTQVESLQAHSSKIPIALVSNTSLGVYALGQLSAMAKTLLGEGFDIEILDIHHRMKKDAPSGTAISTAVKIKGDDTNLNIVKNREIQPRKSNAEIGISALRGGTVFGEHTVYFLGDDETISITHKAGSRLLFARGALDLAQKLINSPNGWYTQENLYLK